MRKFLLICFLTFCSSSCATMFHGTTKEVNIITSNGDTVKADISSALGVQTVILPSTVSVKKGNVPITVSVKEDECHRPTVYKSGNHLDIFFLGNAFNYWTGTSTDISNGAMWTYDDNIIVPIYRKDVCKTK